MMLPEVKRFSVSVNGIPVTNIGINETIVKNFIPQNKEKREKIYIALGELLFTEAIRQFNNIKTAEG